MVAFGDPLARAPKKFFKYLKKGIDNSKNICYTMYVR